MDTVRNFFLFIEIDAFDAGGDGCEDFVGDGVEPLRQLGDGEVRAEDFDAVALGAVRDVSNVNHRHVHADVADVGCGLSVYEACATTVAKVSAEAVGIADGDGSDARGTGEFSTSSIAHSLRRCDVVNLQDGGAEGADRGQGIRN